MDKPLVSVVVPVFNVQNYLRECIESIIYQTYTELEIILVDDGSTDGSGEICDFYKKLDDRILVIHQNNAGLSSARNCGINVATGKYICFVDSDDYIEKEFIKKLLDTIINYDADVVASRYYTLRNEVIDEEYFDQKKTLMLGTEMLINYISYSDSTYIISSSVWDRIYKTELVKGTLFIEGILCEDIVFTTQLLTKAKRCVHYNYAGYFYRIRENSIMTGTNDAKIIKQTLDNYKMQIDILKHSGNEEIVERAKYEFYYHCVDILMDYYFCKDPDVKYICDECLIQMKLITKDVIRCIKKMNLPFLKILIVYIASRKFSLYYFFRNVMVNRRK